MWQIFPPPDSRPLTWQYYLHFPSESSWSPLQQCGVTTTLFRYRHKTVTRSSCHHHYGIMESKHWAENLLIYTLCMSLFCWVLICILAHWSQARASVPMFHVSPRIIKVFRGRDDEKQQFVARPCIYIYIPGAAGGRGPANLLSTAGNGGSSGNVRARF